MAKHRVLIVDDEIAALLAFKRILQSADVLVDTAETMEDAITLLNEHRYKVVIADIRLTLATSEEGFEILKHVKKYTPATKVIIVTGYEGSKIIEKANNLGADLFFEKPLPPHILQNRLKCWGIG
jgi:DNA-binding NtrC family response regulator